MSTVKILRDISKNETKKHLIIQACKHSAIVYVDEYTTPKNNYNSIRSYITKEGAEPIDVAKVVLYRDKRTLYVAFRGSNSPNDLLNALNNKKYPVKCNGKKNEATNSTDEQVVAAVTYCDNSSHFIHRGFYQKYAHIKDVLFAELESICTRSEASTSGEDPIDTIVFTGHSAGASQALMAVYDYVENRIERQIYCFPDVCFYGFGAPLSVNGEFLHYLDGIVKDLHFFSLKNDIVPHLPLHPEFEHHQNIILLEGVSDIPLWDIPGNHSCIQYYHTLIQTLEAPLQ
jgi:hypothetical protein